MEGLKLSLAQCLLDLTQVETAQADIAQNKAVRQDNHFAFGCLHCLKCFPVCEQAALSFY